MTTMARNRFGNFASTSTITGNDHAAQLPGSSLAGALSSTGGSSWKQSGGIWGNTAIGSGMKSGGTLESSRLSDNPAAFSPSSEAVTGSRSLLASSESDDWDRQPNKPWMETSTSRTRSSQNSQSGSSPVRRQNSNQLTPLQPLSQNVSANSSYYSLAQATAAAQGTKRAHDSFLDPTSGTYGGDPFFEAFRNHQSSRHNSNEENRPPSISFHLGPAESPQQSHFHQGSYNNDGVGQYANTSSRSGSLPPSRDGSQFNRLDDNRLTKPNVQFGSFQPQGPLHRSNHSANASMFTNGSQTSTNGISTRPGLDVDNLGIHFGNMQVSRGDPHSLPQGTYPSTNGRAMGIENQPFGTSFASEVFTQDESGAPRSPGSNIPGTMSVAAMQQLQQYRNSPFSGSAASVATNDQRRGQHSPFYSSSGTPPVGHQQRLSSRDNFGNVPNGEAVLLDRKLRGLQQEQTYAAPPPYLPFQRPYPPAYNYNSPNPLRLNPLASYYPVHPAPHMINHHPIPRGPAREHDVGAHLRSPLLEEFRSNSKTNKRYELKDIYNHIVEFSGDQHGSRFIQQKLETANSDEKDQVFREIQPNAVQLMSDVFGNYVIQKFFEHGNQSQKKALANRMKNRVLSLSRQMYGCRVVQKALEHILTDQQASLVNELESNVMPCVKDQNGNHVIQKAIERVPAEHIQFIVNSFAGQIEALSVHPYGCRVIQRLLEHCVEPTRSAVLQELHVCAASLIVDQYGNYVTQHIIEHGREEDRNKVISLVTAQLVQFSKHKFASNVVEKCVQFSTYEQRQVIVNTLTGTNEKGDSTLQHLVRDQYGNYVIQKTLAQLKDDEHTKFVNHIKPQLAILKRFQYSKQITAIEKMVYATTPPAPILQPSTLPTQNHHVDSTSSAPLPPTSSSVSGHEPSPPTAPLPSTQAGSAGG